MVRGEEEALYAPSDDSSKEREKISPEEFTRNVLQECNVIKKAPHHARMLQGGNSIVSKGKTNPAYLATASHTFYGHKLSASGILTQPKIKAGSVTNRDRHIAFEDTGRGSSVMRMGETHLNKQISQILEEQEYKISNHTFRGPPYLPGELERRAHGEMQAEMNRNLGHMFTTQQFRPDTEKKEIYYYP